MQDMTNSIGCVRCFVCEKKNDDKKGKDGNTKEEKIK